MTLLTVPYAPNLDQGTRSDVSPCLSVLLDPDPVDPDPVDPDPNPYYLKKAKK